MEIREDVARSLALAFERMQMLAIANLEERGYQDEATLIICMTEELGEIAREQLAVSATAHADPASAVTHVKKMGAEAVDLGALCGQLAVLIAVQLCTRGDSEQGGRHGPARNEGRG